MRRFTQLIHCAAACLAGAALLLASCERSDNPTESMDVPDMNAQFILQPPAISIEPFGGSTPASRTAVAMKEEQHSFNVGKELGNIITLGSSEDEDIAQTRTLTSSAYCRIVVYKLEEWNAGTLKIWEQRLCKAGSSDYLDDAGDVTTPICLYPGDYRIFCYSFNKTTADKLSPLADGDTNVPLSDGDDFLSVVIDKTILASQLGTDVALGPVTLQHRCCQIIVTLTTEAFDGHTGIAASPDPSLSVTSKFNTAGYWSIKASSFSGTATSSDEKVITLAENSNDYTGTLLLLPLTNQTLSVTYTFKPNGASKTITASKKTISSNTTFSSGVSYSIVIKAIGAYVLTKPTDGYVQIGSNKWAYANLDAATKAQELYPWESGYIGGAYENDYWNWGDLNASYNKSYLSNAPSTLPVERDPCYVYLGSLWRVPSRAYFDELNSYVAQSVKVSINGVTGVTSPIGYITIDTARKGLVFVDTQLGNAIYMPVAGYRQYGNQFTGYSNSGSYLTRETYSSTSEYLAEFSLSYDSNSGPIFISTHNGSSGNSVRCAQ